MTILLYLENNPFKPGHQLKNFNVANLAFSDLEVKWLLLWPNLISPPKSKIFCICYTIDVDVDLFILQIL